MDKGRSICTFIDLYQSKSPLELHANTKLRVHARIILIFVHCVFCEISPPPGESSLFTKLCMSVFANICICMCAEMRFCLRNHAFANGLSLSTSGQFRSLSWFLIGMYTLKHLHKPSIMIPEDVLTASHRALVSCEWHFACVQACVG